MFAHGPNLKPGRRCCERRIYGTARLPMSRCLPFPVAFDRCPGNLQASVQIENTDETLGPCDISRQHQRRIYLRSLKRFEDARDVDFGPQSHLISALFAPFGRDACIRLVGVNLLLAWSLSAADAERPSSLCADQPCTERMGVFNVPDLYKRIGYAAAEQQCRRSRRAGLLGVGDGRGRGRL
ncbi:hypothetical protein SRABI89_05336 [Pseudomonas koreensis]|nr:hypothetical protein SRABI89_05336 [Pseudomonas koreensis]